MRSSSSLRLGILRIGSTFVSNSIRLFLLLAFILCTACIANAQQDVGYILGTVSDQTGAVVPNAKITITWQSTGLSHTLTTDASGYYVSPPLQVGQYTVTVEKAGFSSTAVHDLTIDAAAHMQANLTVHVGATSTNVTVQATPPVMDTTDGEIATTIDTRAAQQLPVNGRSVLALTTLSPGVESAVGAVSEGFQNRGTAVSAIRINGSPNGINNNILDGVTNMQDWLGEIAINLKSDAVQEFRVMSGIIPAQFGYTAGGVINVVTRSGTNSLHGSAYEFIRNDAFDAAPSFPRPQYGKGALHFNNYGGTLGGPVLRNKMFLFGNYEQYSYSSRFPHYYTVPTVQERDGDFRDLGQLVNGVCTTINIYDDANIVNGQRQQFVTSGRPNVIPTGRLDAVALAYQKLFYPMPNNIGGAYNSCSHANNYLESNPQVSTEKQGIVRADYKATNNDSFVARYAYYVNAFNNGGGFVPIFNDRNDTLQTQSAVLSETHVFSPTLLNDARFGLMIGDFPFLAAHANKDIAGQIGLPNSTPYLAPQMNNSLPTPNESSGFRSSTTIELLDDLTWLLGNHSLHVGGSARWTEGFNSQGGASTSGTFNFSAGTSGQGNDTTVIPGTGNTYASYLLGQVTSASQLVASGTAFRRMMYAGYIQDDWRVTPRLTINAGLRYDMMTQAVEKHNGIENFNITKPNPTNSLFAGLVEYANTNGYGRNFVKENFGDFGPRLGFAYALDRDSKTILRGGAAVYYASTASYNYDQSSGNPAGYTSMNTSWSAPTAHGYLFQLSSGLPGPWKQPPGAAGGANAFLGQGASYINPVAKDPSAQVLGLTISRALPYAVVLDVSYSGNHGNHFENYSPNLNFLSPQYYSLGTAALSAQVPNPYFGLVPGSLGAATLTRAQLLKPYPYMSGVSMLNPRNGSYWSNMGMLSVQRRVEHGLQIMGAYTFGKTTDAGVAGVSDLSYFGTLTSAGPQNPYDPRADHSVDTIDVAHRLTIAGLYDLPFGKGGLLLTSSKTDRLFSGWQVNSILTMESGRPLGITGANNQLASRPNLNPNVKLLVPHQSRSVLYRTGQLEWFNPLAFVNPPDYTFGNAPRKFSALRGPGTVNLDVSLFKTTHITERTTLELRIEAYNALNHPNLPNPDTSFSAGKPADPNNPYAEGGFNTNPSFGMITSGATTTRNVQLGAKLSF
jgi:hypothetical protein